MKILIILFLLAFSSGINAQGLKTIYANDKQVVALFFPNSIRQAVVGTEKFTFSYNKERPQYVGLLQGSIGQKSNLLVLTDNGEVYSYLLAYRKMLDTLNYFVSVKESIGRERPIQIISSIDSISKVTIDTVKTKFDSLQNRNEYFDSISSYHLKRNQNSLKKKRKKGIILRLKDLIYDGSEVYVLIEIKNRSGIDFEVDYLKIFMENGNNRRKASYQKLLLPPMHQHNFPSMVKDGESATFVVVLPKFTLGDSDRVLVELKEFRGNRILQMVHK